MKAFIIAKREYLKMIKSKTFWLATLLLPVLMIVITLIQVYSSQSMTNKIQEQMSGQKILISDIDSHLNRGVIASENIVFIDELEVAKELIKDGSFDLLIEIPVSIITEAKINIYANDQGILSTTLYEQLSLQLMKGSVLAGIKDPYEIFILSDQVKVMTYINDEGNFKTNTWTNFIIPLASVIIYFIFTSFATANLLLSVSEEKENRMIEIVLSSIKPRDLILGKIMGILSAVFTQIIILLALVLIIFLIGQNNFDLPFNLADLKIEPLQIFISLIYLILGFLFLANIMVACGSAMPTYREASNFSSIFIMLSIFPVYFFTLILAEPAGTIAIITSYFPFTAPMILMLRNALGVVSYAEILFSFIILSIYVYLSFKLAYKLFEFGAMEYSNKISFGNFFKGLLKH